VNYYHRYLIARDPANSLGVRWVVPKEGLIHAPGLGALLKETSAHLSDRMPLIVSENGLADAEDKIRRGFIRDHLEVVRQTRAAGIDVRGYWYWSLTDNFEWLSGYGPRFGLIEIDYGTLKRTIRPSAYWYRDFIKAHPEGP
jgi:beta-glucosidase